MSQIQLQYLLSNVHDGVELTKKKEKLHLVTGKYEYYHYCCDGVDDRGWGCGYRTLQTISSWMNNNMCDGPEIPTIPDIQTTLVEMQDKPKSFLGSREWIGCFEACLIIDKLYDTPCKILHVNSGDELASITGDLVKHFNKFGCPVMMGGDADCSSKCIVGISMGDHEPSLLIVDPHYVGKTQTKEFLQNKGWVKWQPLSEFMTSSFYNLCLPQATAKCQQASPEK